MTVGNNQVSPEEINLAHRLQPEPTPFLRPNQQADSHHQCEPGSTAAADLAMWKQAKASQNARKCACVVYVRLQESQTREEHRKMVQIEFLWGIFVSVFAAFAGLLFFGGISSSLEARKTRKRQNLTGEWKTERIEELDCREHQIINPLPMRSPNAKPRKCAHSNHRHH